MQEVRQKSIEINSAQIFLAGFLAACAVAALLIGCFPLQLSIVSVFLFAGAHNAFEFRYFAARMPVRWGKSKTYYSVGIGGVFVLTATYLMLYFGIGDWLWNAKAWAKLSAIWNTALIFWVGVLFYLRGQQKPKTDWSEAIAVALLIAVLAWIAPQYWGIGLIYLHPLIALWFLERQIRRTKKEWIKAYHLCLAALPVFLLFLWLALSGKAQLSEETGLFQRITSQAGAGVFPQISSHLLVATHVFLETIHYSVWILLIPLVDRRAVPWNIKEIPLFSNKQGYPKLFVIILIFSLLLIPVLWIGFAGDYVLTRDIYFAFAMAHVLAEFPFLIKML